MSRTMNIIQKLRENLNESSADLRAIHTYVASELETIFSPEMGYGGQTEPKVKDVSFHGEDGYKIEVELVNEDFSDFDPAMLEKQVLAVVRDEDSAVRDIESEIDERNQLITFYVTK